MMEDDITWWCKELIRHHGSAIAAFQAQVRHIGAEYGEMLGEIEINFGENPRKEPEDRVGEINKELCDIIVSALITLQLWMDMNGDCLRLSERIVANRIKFTRRRLEEYQNDRGI